MKSFSYPRLAAKERTKKGVRRDWHRETDRQFNNATLRRAV